MIKTIYKNAAKHYKLRKMDSGEFSHFQGRGMKFRVATYKAVNGGSLCLMKMKGFFGLMKMETAVFSPIQKDGPLFSMDYINAFGKQTLFLELYDTTLSHPEFEDLIPVKKAYSHLPSYDPGSHWYDSLSLPASDYNQGRKLDTEFKDYVNEFSKKYFEILHTCPPCHPAEKKKKNAEYANGLLENGGPAVNQFVKMIGKEKTALFLKKYMFGAE